MWAEVVRTAVTIDAGAMLERLRNTLDWTDDRRPGSGSPDNDGRRSTTRNCSDPTCPDAGQAHSHNAYTDPTGDTAIRPSHTASTLQSLAQAEQAFIAAVDWLAQRSVSGAHVDTWDDAVHTANLLDELGLIDDTARIHPAAAKNVRQARSALWTIIGHVRDNAPHPPNSWQRMADENGRPACRAHATIGVRNRPCTSKLLCKWCWDQLHYLDGDPVALQWDKGTWPSPDMLRAHEASDRIRIKRARHEWIVSQDAGRSAS